MTWVKEFVAVVDPQTAVSLSDTVPEIFIPALRDGPFEIFNDLGVELKRLLHVSQEYRYLHPLKFDEWVESESSVTDLKEKTSKLGDIYILDVQSKFFQKGEVCVESLMRVFVRR